MANICFTEVTITSDNEEFLKGIIELYQKNKGGDFSFMEHFYPLPDELKVHNPTFVSIGEKPFFIDGAFQMLPIDKNGRTKEQYNAYCEELLAKYGASTEYDWKKRNWGCKWMDINTSLLEKNKLYLEYETPWVSNLEFWMNFTEIYPDTSVEGYYEESGCGLCGRFSCENGELSEVDLDYDSEHPGFSFDNVGDKYEFKSSINGDVIVRFDEADDLATLLFCYGIKQSDIINYAELEEFYFENC